MDKDTRNAIERATQRARKLLEEDFAAQLEGDFDVHRDGAVAVKAGGHLSARQAFQRERILAAIEHKRAIGMGAADSVADYLRDAAFTTLNRFVALKMLEARELVQECITKGEQSAGYREFCGMAPGLPLLPDSAGYRLYIESLFDELSTEVKVLFDRGDPSSVLWPKRSTFEELLEILNATELAGVWGEDETIGWVYQFFNGQDERKKMREESQAPRNSRELAVRNQFFTPRYVVQFLTDNTLGRIWYEMRATKTALADRCEYMVRKPGEEFAPRAKKDPRDLRVLDPACGSGHFLLYAFDLLLAIYEEAHADPESPKSEATGRTLAEDYPSLDALRNAAPGLVLAHNLHGVDIDPRCAQIAQLALWMRAQKAYRDFSVGRGERAQIRRSNIVVAEPLVADDRIAKEFVAKLGDAELERLFTSLSESLSLAGDLGLLLPVEQLVARQAKRGQTGDLFAPPEERIRAALDRFLREEVSARNTRRRLFADDAAHGVALLGVAEKKFDTVLMNPPFGEVTQRGYDAIKSLMKASADNLYAAFHRRACDLAPHGLVGLLCSRTFVTYREFEEYRTELLLRDAPIREMADLGWGVLDGAQVETAAVTTAPGTPMNSSMWFIRATDLPLEDKSTVLRRQPTERLFCKTAQAFERLDGRPLCYWSSDAVLEALRNAERLYPGRAYVGLGASPHAFFFRLAWEVTPQCRGNSKWRPITRGGNYSPYFRANPLVMLWERDGYAVKQYISQKYPYLNGNYGWKIQDEDYYGKPGLTWGKRNERFNVQVLPAGMIFTDEGQAAIPHDPSDVWFLLGYLNSGLVAYFLELTSGLQKQYGYIRPVPIVELADATRAEIANLAKEAYEIKKQWAARMEPSEWFRSPIWLEELPIVASSGFVDLVHKHEIDSARLNVIAATISSLVQQELPLGDADRVEIAGAAGRRPPDVANSEWRDLSFEGIQKDLAVRLVSWAFGATVGRWDAQLQSTPMPACVEEAGKGAAGYGEGLPARKDVLVDDPGARDDVAALIQNMFDASDGLRGRIERQLRRPLREWLANEFFGWHLERHSRVRRKAPVYWQLATPSASYSVWLYIHAFSKDTLFRVQNDYAAPKLAHEERRIESLMSELRDGATAAQRKTLAAQESLVEELRAFLDEVKRVAPLWKPNLNDGVIINFAPLWRLVPQNKSWQKELKSTLDALCEGKYDWAHLAMHLWPERVVPKCATDRSLAIAHGLEDVFWVEGTAGKWTARKAPTCSVEELVRERTSPAVKSALKSLLEAPSASGTSRKTKKGKTNA